MDFIEIYNYVKEFWVLVEFFKKIVEFGRFLVVNFVVGGLGMYVFFVLFFGFDIVDFRLIYDFWFF